MPRSVARVGCRPDHGAGTVSAGYSDSPTASRAWLSVRKLRTRSNFSSFTKKPSSTARGPRRRSPHLVHETCRPRPACHRGRATPGVQGEDLPVVGVPEVARQPVSPVVDGRLDRTPSTSPTRNRRRVISTRAGTSRQLKAETHLPGEHDVLLRHRLLRQPRGFEGLGVGGYASIRTIVPVSEGEEMAEFSSTCRPLSRPTAYRWHQRGHRRPAGTRRGTRISYRDHTSCQFEQSSGAGRRGRDRRDPSR